jgi:hypothetical protein
MPGSEKAGRMGSGRAMRSKTKIPGCKEDKMPESLEDSICMLISKSFILRASMLSSLQAFKPPSFFAFQPPSILKGSIHAYASLFESRSFSRRPGIA